MDKRNEFREISPDKASVLTAEKSIITACASRRGGKGFSSNDFLADVFFRVPSRLGAREKRDRRYDNYTRNVILFALLFR